MRATYDHTLQTDTVLKIMKSIEQCRGFRIPESQEWKRYAELKQELLNRGLFSQAKKASNYRTK